MTEIRNKKYLMIINPQSGSNYYTKQLFKVKNYFEKRNAFLETVFTQYKGHATVIAQKIQSKDYDAIICAGGDGTINEVLNGLIGSNMTMAVLPWGTANVFAREMKIPLTLKKAIKLIIKGNSTKIDIARSNSHYFFMMCSTGFDAYTIKQTEILNIKKFLGKFAYILGSIKAFTRYHYPAIEVEYDDGTRDQGTFIIISNTSKYAGLFSITPRANPVDGLLDIYIYKLAGTLNLFKLIIQIILATFLKDKKRKSKKIILHEEAYKKAKKIKLTSQEPIISQLDGDLSDPLPLNIEVIPRAINFILPKKTIKKLNKY